MNEKKSVIFGLSGSKKLAKEISTITNIELGDSALQKFADSEMIFKTKTSVRNKYVFVIQSTSNPANERIMELLIFLDLLKRSSAKEINVIIPYFGYSRQDRKNNGRQPITSSLVAKLIESAGADRVTSFDFHSPQIQGFFRIPVDELRAVGILAKALRKQYREKEKFIVVSPDHGGVSRARSFAKFFDSKLAIVDKRRTSNNKAEALNIIGDVENKNCVIIDDIIDTGGTLSETIKKLEEMKAKNIYLLSTHAVFSSKTNDENEVIEKLLNFKNVKKIIITNSIEREIPKKYKDKIIVCDLSSVISGVISTHLKNDSITDYFIKEYNTIL